MRGGVIIRPSFCLNGAEKKIFRFKKFDEMALAKFNWY
jgi:hypothetical protein